MLFQERKTNTGYEYKVEDVFGSITIESEQKMSGDLLDEIVVILLRKNISAQTVTGEFKLTRGKVNYTFVKAPMWEEDEEVKTPCEDTPTSTKETVSLFTRMSRSLTLTLAWCRQFVVAFQEAWKKAKEKN